MNFLYYVTDDSGLTLQRKIYWVANAGYSLVKKVYFTICDRKI